MEPVIILHVNRIVTASPVHTGLPHVYMPDLYRFSAALLTTAGDNL